jgi:hypothetical protein
VASRGPLLVKPASPPIAYGVGEPPTGSTEKRIVA